MTVLAQGGEPGEAAFWGLAAGSALAVHAAVFWALPEFDYLPQEVTRREPEVFLETIAVTDPNSAAVERSEQVVGEVAPLTNAETLDGASPAPLAAPSPSRIGSADRPTAETAPPPGSSGALAPTDADAMAARVGMDELAPAAPQSVPATQDPSPSSRAAPAETIGSTDAAATSTTAQASTVAPADADTATPGVAEDVAASDGDRDVLTTSSPDSVQGGSDPVPAAKQVEPLTSAIGAVDADRAAETAAPGRAASVAGQELAAPSIPNVGQTGQPAPDATAPVAPPTAVGSAPDVAPSAAVQGTEPVGSAAQAASQSTPDTATVRVGSIVPQGQPTTVTIAAAQPPVGSNTAGASSPAMSAPIGAVPRVAGQEAPLNRARAPSTPVTSALQSGPVDAATPLRQPQPTQAASAARPDVVQGAGGSAPVALPQPADAIRSETGPAAPAPVSTTSAQPSLRAAPQTAPARVASPAAGAIVADTASQGPLPVLASPVTRARAATDTPSALVGSAGVVTRAEEAAPVGVAPELPSAQAVGSGAAAAPLRVVESSPAAPSGPQKERLAALAEPTEEAGAVPQSPQQTDPGDANSTPVLPPLDSVVPLTPSTSATPDVLGPDTAAIGAVSALDRVRYATILDFVRRFDGGDCFAAVPTLSEVSATLALDVFGETQSSLDRFAAGLRDEAGVIPNAVLKPISAPQCAALAFVSTIPSYPQLSVELVLDSRSIKNGEQLRGQIRPQPGLHTYLLLVDDEGAVTSLNRFAKVGRDTDRVRRADVSERRWRDHGAASFGVGTSVASF